MSAAWLNAVPAAVFAQIPAASVAKFGSSACAGLDVAHVQALTVAQMAALYYPEKLGLAAVAALTPAQVAAIGTSFYWMGADWINALTPAAFAAVTPAGIGQLASTTIAALDVAHVQALKGTQLDAMNLGALTSASVAALTQAQITAISAAKWGSLSAAWINATELGDWAAVSAAAVAKLSITTQEGLDAAHVAAMSPAQIAALQNADHLSAGAVAVLSAAQVAAITTSFYWMSPAWLNALTPAAFAAITPAGIAQMKSTTIAGLDAAHVGAMGAAQVAVLDYWQRTALTSTQMGWFSASAIAGFSTAQLDDLSPAQLAGLGATQAAGLSAAQIASLDYAQVAALSASAVSALGATQLAALGTNIAALTPAALAALPAATFQKLSFMQIGALETDQIAALTQPQLAALSAAQVNYLTPGQLAALDGHVQWLSATAVTGLNNVNLISVYASLTATQKAGLTSAQQALVAKAGTATADLLKVLTTSGIRTQVEAVINAGDSLFSHESLLKVLQGVDTAIGTGQLAAAQMTELKALVTAVGQAVGTDSYLYEISSNVVNGNKSNALWTGGLNTSVALGNLAVGSSADQMARLIGKWFLGTDLPSYVGATYAARGGTLFSAAGPLASDVQQRGVGDCYFLAAMVDVADDYSALIESMFTDNGNGTWGIRFYGAGDDPLYVTVNTMLPTGWTGAVSATGGLWVSLLEKAYVEYEVQMNGEANAYASIEGGWSSGLQAIAGLSSRSYGCASYTVSAWTSTVKSAVLGAIGAGQEVMYATASGTSLTDANGRTDLVGSHMYAVLGYDSALDRLILRNPWGQEGSSSWNGVFELGFDQLYLSNCSLIVTTESAPTGAIDPKYAVNAGQLVQALATLDAGAAGGAGAGLGASPAVTDRTQITLASAG